tara:strand:+ start:432 stop:710 length:279 start_codon:yes stop_codon:yes gene_type:complete
MLFNQYRFIIIVTPNYNNQRYLKIMNRLNLNRHIFDKRYTKIISRISKSNKIEIILVGFDNKIKKKYSNLSILNLIKAIDNMPLGKILKPDQ